MFHFVFKSLHSFDFTGLYEAPCLYKVQQNDNLWSHGEPDHMSSRNKPTICTFCVAEAKRAAMVKRRGQKDRCRSRPSDYLDNGVSGESDKPNSLPFG